MLVAKVPEVVNLQRDAMHGSEMIRAESYAGYMVPEQVIICHRTSTLGFARSWIGIGRVVALPPDALKRAAR